MRKIGIICFENERDPSGPEGIPPNHHPYGAVLRLLRDDHLREDMERTAGVDEIQPRVLSNPNNWTSQDPVTVKTRLHKELRQIYDELVSRADAAAIIAIVERKTPRTVNYPTEFSNGFTIGGGTILLDTTMGLDHTVGPKESDRQLIQDLQKIRAEIFSRKIPVLEDLANLVGRWNWEYFGDRSLLVCVPKGTQVEFNLDLLKQILAVRGFFT